VNLESLFRMICFGVSSLGLPAVLDQSWQKEADDLLLAIEQELRRQRFGSTVRLEIKMVRHRHPPDADAAFTATGHLRS